MQGIPFRKDMFEAIRESKKTVTRRLSGLKEINLEPDTWRVYKSNDGKYWIAHRDRDRHQEYIKSRYKVGETVYVKEAWAGMASDDNVPICDMPHDPGTLFYKLAKPDAREPIRGKWRSPLFMPAWAARYFIQFTGVRPERLWAITEEDAIAEGMEPEGTTKPNGYEAYDDPIEEYAQLWDSINKIHKWNTNPRVFVYSFKRIDRPKYEVLE